MDDEDEGAGLLVVLLLLDSGTALGLSGGGGKISLSPIEELSNVTVPLPLMILPPELLAALPQAVVSTITAAAKIAKTLFMEHPPIIYFVVRYIHVLFYLFIKDWSIAKYSPS